MLADISDYTIPDPRYGKLEEVDELIKKCHDHGMKIIFDLGEPRENAAVRELMSHGCVSHQSYIRPGAHFASGDALH